MTDHLEAPAYKSLLAAAMHDHSLSDAQKLIDDYVHELAEKIRMAAEVKVGWGQPMREAADLIDPEAP